MLVVGPNLIGPNQQYKLTIINNNGNWPKVTVQVLLEGKNFSSTQRVEVTRFQLKSVNFRIPNVPPSSSMKLTIDGTDGFNFHKEVNLEVRSKSISGFIQSDKPVYKPGDMVRFRVIVLDTELKPPANLESIQVTIMDSKGNVVKNWNAAKLFIGVFESDLQVASAQILGSWSISVKVGEEHIVSKTFEVKEYVLSPIDLQVVPSVIPLAEHQGLNLTVAVKDYSGKSLQGLAKVELYVEDRELGQMQEFEMHGLIQKWVPFNNDVEVSDNQQNVRVRVTFIEQDTNHTAVQETEITVYKYPYRVELVKSRPQFRPGFQFKCVLQFRYHDGTPAKDISGRVEVEELGYEKEATTDDEGLIKLELLVNESIEQFDIMFVDYDFLFIETVRKVPTTSNIFINLELKSNYTKQTEPIDLEVTCNERMAFFVYYVVTKGKIVDCRLIKTGKANKHRITINASENMFPTAKIIVATVDKNDKLVWDSLDVDFAQHANHLDIIVEKNVFKLGDETEFILRGRPGSYVGLAAYDMNLLDVSKHHGINVKDMEEMYNRFHVIHPNELDSFSSTGLFFSIDSYTVLGLRSTVAPFGYYSNQPETKSIPNRSSFMDTWLWKHVTIGSTRTHKLNEMLPKMSATWCLTGFTIHPKYGLGIGNPIQIRTISQFYIEENLPQSIIRGEETVLQVTIFNNLRDEHIVNVTLHNVAKEMEFVGRPETDESYTKSVSVPPNIGVPVSFLVKARKLGEMTIQIKLTTMNGLEMDALEKVVRVMPEYLVFNKTLPSIFKVRFGESYSMTHRMDITNISGNNSHKMWFKLYLIENPENLLPTPKESTESNMIDFMISIAVLEYLEATDSSEMLVKKDFLEMVTIGYQTFMKFRQSSGAFSNSDSSNSKGNVFMTVLAVQTLSLASKYIWEADVNMVYKASDWLVSRQHSSGRFDEVGEITYPVLQDESRNGVALTSYVMIAFLENSFIIRNDNTKRTIDMGINYVAALLPTITDPYDLSLATYALLLYNHTAKDTAFMKLFGMSEFVNNGTERYWPRVSASIATTAYGLLCFAEADSYFDSIGIMRWLEKQRETPDSLAHAHATFVGLQALAKIWRASHGTDFTVRVIENSRFKTYKIPSSELEQKYEHMLNDDSKMIQVDILGRGSGMYEIVCAYTVDIKHINNCFKLKLEVDFTNSNYRLNLKVCTNFETSLLFNRSNMAIVEVNFPSGFVADKNSIENLSNGNPIMNVEQRYKNTTLMVYYASIGPEESCFKVTANRLLKVAFQRESYVLVHDAYHPGQLRNMMHHTMSPACLPALCRLYLAIECQIHKALAVSSRTLWAVTGFVRA
uniref:Alpha-2-macroglobulin domain-containing protein n=1 Tax=Anopheles dirus TaxID=7168 RepID=A0A182NV61_9DIPT